MVHEIKAILNENSIVGKKSNRSALYLNKYVKWIVIWTIIKIGMRASSIVWMSRLLNGNMDLFICLTLIMGSYILSIIPDSMISVEIYKAEFHAFKLYSIRFSEVHQNSPELILDNRFRREQEPLLTNQGRLVFKDTYLVLGDLILSFFTIVVDALTMSVVIDWLYCWAYGCSALIYVVITKTINSKLENYAEASLNEGKPLINTLFACWDNIVIGNNYNINLWFNNFRKSYENSRKATLNYAIYLRITEFFGTVSTCLPILGTTIYLFYQNSGDFIKMALLLSILPRQISTIQFFSMFSSSIIKWGGIRKQLDNLNDSVLNAIKNSRRQPAYRIFWDKLSFMYNKKPKKFESLKDFLDQTSGMKTGRITIRGENGAGKSVLICMLKSHLNGKKIDSFYLPAKSDLIFSVPLEEKSSGEQMTIKINEIMKYTDEKFILLDEWDANLDHEKIENFSRYLEKISKERCIIEIRHRHDINGRFNKPYASS